LFALADLAGGEWPAGARSAALALSAGREGDDASYGVRLLADVRVVLDEAGTDRMGSSTLCAALNAVEESPWGGWNDGKGIGARDLARRMREYDVVPGTVRLPDGSQSKGYRREKFADARARYCPSEGPENAAGTVISPPPSATASASSRRATPTFRCPTGRCSPPSPSCARGSSGPWRAPGRCWWTAAWPACGGSGRRGGGRS
jgi:hypothetical protein